MHAFMNVDSMALSTTETHHDCKDRLEPKAGAQCIELGGALCRRDIASKTRAVRDICM